MKSDDKDWQLDFTNIENAHWILKAVTWAVQLRLLLDDTGIVWGYRALANALFVTYGFLSSGFFLRLILTMKAVGIPKFGHFPSRLYFLGGTIRLGLVRRSRLIKLIGAILAN